MSSEADENAINVKSSGLSSLLGWEARTGNMVFDISVISVGAVLILLLLMALIFRPRAKSEKDDMNENTSGIYLHAVHFCLDQPPSPNSSISPVCFQT